MISPIESIVAFLDPTVCYLCKIPGDVLCLSCIQTNLWPDVSRCYMCNKLSKNPGRCSSCSSSLRRLWWLGTYKSELKEVIKAMKYHRRRDYARTLGNRLSEQLPFLSNDTIVVPMPTAASRIRTRGFNQAEIITKTFAKKRGLKVLSCVIRTKDIDLVGRSRLDRIRLMKSSLECTVDLTGINSALLIDDVITTGASLETAARLLRVAGAKHVDAAVAAH